MKKNRFKRTLSLFLAVLMLLGSAPLAGLAGIELPDVFKTEAKAGVSHYNGIAAAEWAKEHVDDSWSKLLGQGYYDDGGDCANFVSQCIYMGGMDMTPAWNSSGFYTRFSSASYGAWIRAHQLYEYVVSQGGTSIQGPQSWQVSVGDLLFWKTTNDGCMHHSAIVIDIQNGVPVIAYHSTRYSNGAYINVVTSDWTLGKESYRTFLVKMNGELCVASNPKDFDVYIADRGTNLKSSPSDYAANAYPRKSIFKGDYVHVYRTQNNWGYAFYYGAWGWVNLSKFHWSYHASSYRPSHIFGSWFTAIEPTCISEGTSKRVCSRCGYTETKQIAPKGHTPGAEPTCITPQTCTVCHCLLKDALGHDLEEEFVAADCYNGAKISGNCKRCDLKYSYAATTAPWSGWSPVSHYVEDPNDERQRVAYRWRQRDTKVTNTASENGWTCTNKSWEQTDSGTIDYVPQWPSQFNTSHWLYSTYNKTPRYASETATNKTTVSTTDIGYIFWHWCRGTTDGRSNQNRSISWYYGGTDGKHNTYHAYKVDSPFSFKSGDRYNVYESFSPNLCEDTKWWYSLYTGGEGLLTVKRCNYTDYRIKCSWEKYSDWSDWSASSELPENIQNMIKNGQSTLTVGNTTYTVEKRNEYQYSLKNALGHDWKTNWLYKRDPDTRKQIWNVVTKPTATESGKAVAICNRDSSHTMEKVLPPTGCSHVWGDWSEIPCPEGGTSTRTCSLCGEKEEKVFDEGHIWESWKIVKEVVTCKEDGLMRRVCKRTPQNPPAESHVQERVIPAHSPEYVETVDPTCTKDGYDVYKCAVCSTEEKKNVVSALGHDMGEYVLTKAPTCTEKGEEVSTCRRCGYTESKDVAALGHDVVANELPVTVINPGDERYETTCEIHETTYKCSRCEYTEPTKTEELGHDWEKNADGSLKWNITIEPEHGKNGEKINKCLRHEEHVRTDAVPMPDDHKWEDKVVTVPCSYDSKTGIEKKGSKITSSVCKICKEEVPIDLEVIDHNFGEWKTVKEATCTEEGENRRICSVCGYPEIEVLSVTGHSASPLDSDYAASTDKMELVSSVKNVCGNGTIDTYQCKHINKNTNERCTYTVVIGEQNDHVLGDYIVTEEPTCTEPGYKHKECVNGDYRTPDERIEPIGHNYQESTKTPATCTEPAKTLMVCKNDSSHRYEKPDGQPLGHDIVKDAKVEPTCVKTGLTEGTHCKREGCGKIFEKQEVVPELGHDYGAWVDDGNSKTHTKTCKRDICNDTVTEHIVTGNHSIKETDRKEATCYEEGYVEYTCSDCGYKYREPLSVIEHTQGEAIKENVVEPTCTEDGSYDEVVYCSVEECKAELSRTHKTTEKLGHDWDKWISVDGENHKHICKRDESHVETAKHKIKETDRKEATCTVDGYIDYKCEDCDYTYRDILKAPGHKYVDVVTEPTCLTEGFTTHTCSVCGDNYVDSKVAALGHDYGEWVDDGNGKTHTKTCKRDICNDTVTEHIVTGNHSIKETDRKEATCYEEGYVEYTCSDCGYKYREPLSVIEHTQGEAIKENVVEPTCTEDGSYDEVVYCSVEECKAELSRTHKTTEKLGHDWDKWISVDGENHKHICKRDESHVETVKHSMKETDRKNAKCYEEGYVEYTCSDCGYSYKNILEKGEHNLGEWNDDNDTVHTSYCQNEGCTYSVTKDHVFDTILEKKDASAREGGYIIYQCSACGHTKRENIPPVDPSDIVPEKEVTEVGGKALITLSASAATNYVKVITESKVPVDVVLVLDQSGSMACDVSAAPNARVPDGWEDNPNAKANVLKQNAKSFVNAIIADAKKTGADHRIALVGFAMGKSYYNGYYDYQNTGLLATNSEDKCINYTRLTLENYADALIPAVNNKTKLEDGINRIEANGATATGVGLNIASNIFANSENDSGRKRVVLLITDGVPTYNASNERSRVTKAASEAIKEAYFIKNCQNASIYTLAVYQGADVNAEFTEDADGCKMGYEQIMESYDINRFMHLVSSNYPKATAMDKNSHGEGSKTSGYYMTAKDKEAFYKCFETVKNTEITDTALFDLVTLYDTLSPNLTLTLEDEAAMRTQLKNDYGMRDEDIVVIREKDGTTKIEFHNVKVNHVDGKYLAKISFKASLNKNVLEKGNYETNTKDAGVKINEIAQKNFEIPSVTVDKERCIVEFFINGVSYSIVDYELGDKIELPATDLATWSTAETVSERYTSYEADSVSDKEYTVTWKANGKEITENYKYGSVIFAPKTVDPPEGMMFAYWTPSVAHFMPAYDLTYTAVYKKAHKCSFVETYEGDCTSGLVLVKTCACGRVERTAFEPTAHKAEAVVINETGSGRFFVRCKVCGKSNKTDLKYKGKEDHRITYFDFNLSKKGVSIQPGENGLVISIYLGRDFNGKEINVYRFDGNGANLISERVKVENDWLTFTADHFSIYALCELDENGNVIEEPSYVKALCALNGHDYKAVVTPPTCTSEGYTTYTCSVCADSYKDDITQKTAHTYVAAETPATCTSGGYTIFTCSVCGSSYKGNEIPAFGHNDSNGDEKCDHCGAQLQSGGSSGKCSHICHSSNSFMKLIWTIIRFFCKIFNTNKKCSCGVNHW